MLLARARPFARRFALSFRRYSCCRRLFSRRRLSLAPFDPAQSVSASPLPVRRGVSRSSRGRRVPVVAAVVAAGSNYAQFRSAAPPISSIGSLEFRRRRASCVAVSAASVRVTINSSGPQYRPRTGRGIHESSKSHRSRPYKYKRNKIIHLLSRRGLYPE